LLFVNFCHSGDSSKSNINFSVEWVKKVIESLGKKPITQQEVTQYTQRDFQEKEAKFDEWMKKINKKTEQQRVKVDVPRVKSSSNQIKALPAGAVELMRKNMRLFNNKNPLYWPKEPFYLH